MREYQLYINGESADSRSKGTIDSINPFS